MSHSVVDICNIAIARLGGTKISSIDENVKPAKLCKVFYETARDTVLSEDIWWSFATKRVALARLATAPLFDEYDYAYQLPSDCLVPRKLSDETVDYDIEQDTLVTSADEVELIYTFSQTDTSKFSEPFVNALAFRLAAELALPMTQRATNQANFIELYKQELSKAKRGDTRKKNKTKTKGSRWVNSRNGGDYNSLPKKLNTDQD